MFCFYFKGAAEIAFDVITPDASVRRKRLDKRKVSDSNLPPNDIRDGLNRAYATVKQVSLRMLSF